MPVEASMGQPMVALLVGDSTRAMSVELDRTAKAGWRLCHVADVYGALARLLRAGEVRCDAVVVLVESLRGDELRFFDILARRWPDLPTVAVHAVSAEDRRLEACRRRGVVVVPADRLAEWLVGHGAVESPDGFSPDAGPPVEEEAPDCDEQEPAQSENEEPAIAEAGTDQEGAEGAPDNVPLTPWSDVPRARRRKGPGAGVPEPVSDGRTANRRAEDASASTSRGAPAAGPSSSTSGEHGLLTPEELRALLQEPDGPGEVPS